MTNTPYFTIILPIHRQPTYLPLSVASVLNQSFKNFELFIILDGAPEETYDCAKEFSKSDDRIKVFKFPKGKRHGEAHRARALEEAGGKVITHINDDSLWFADHLAIIHKYGSHLDFGHTLHTEITENDKITSITRYLEQQKTRNTILSKHHNFANMCDVFYSRKAYQNLNEKWSPAPEDIATDQYMWEKFLEEKSRLGTIYTCTALFFDYPKNFSDEKSYRHIKKWLKKIKTDEAVSMIRSEVEKIHTEKVLKKYGPFSRLFQMFLPKNKISKFHKILTP